MSDNESSGADRPKVIVQISDVHIAGSGNLHETVDSLANLTTILRAIEAGATTPDLLLFSGDLADKGEPEAYARFRGAVEPYLERSGVPVLYVPGNHDVRTPFRQYLLEWEANEDVIDQVVDVDGLRVVALDSTVPGKAHGELDDAQLEWLDEVLSTPAPFGTVVTLHHPPIPGPSAFLNEIILHEPDRFAEVIVDRDVKMVIAGHTHHVSAGAVAGIPVWVATASAYQMDVIAASGPSMRGIPGSGFSWIDVFEDAVVATHIPVLAYEKPVYEVDFETIRRFIAEEASIEEVEAAFAPAESAE